MKGKKTSMYSTTDFYQIKTYFYQMETLYIT